MANITDFLTPEALRKLESLAIRSRYVSEGAQSGAHKSKLKGQSVEFADRREYVKGDNLRHLDWKVFARTEKYFIRQFEEETSLRVHLLLDASRSMAFGGQGRPHKYDYATRLCAALAYLVTKQQDSVSLTVYDQEVRDRLPCRNGARHLRTLVDRLAVNEPRNVTNTGKALHSLAEQLSRRGLIVIFSDCMDDPDGIFSAIAHFRKRMNDVVLLQILDPVELELSIDTVSEFVDMETGERLELDPAHARKAYKDELQRFIDGIRERCGVMNVDYRLVSTADGFDDFIQQYLIDRRRMAL
ncbi:MAG: hypothetical protein RLZZ399_881 [Verrucomicrobiota bacterium]|jgi:uncharacterized protein (DUF58 family)